MTKNLPEKIYARPAACAGASDNSERLKLWCVFWAVVGPSPAGLPPAYIMTSAGLPSSSLNFPLLFPPVPQPHSLLTPKNQPTRPQPDYRDPARSHTRATTIYRQAIQLFSYSAIYPLHFNLSSCVHIYASQNYCLNSIVTLLGLIVI